MRELSEQQLIIATQTARRFLFGGEAVHFYIVKAVSPLWVKTPQASYPMLPDEELTIVMPDKSGSFRIDFTCGTENIGFTYVVA